MKSEEERKNINLLFKRRHSESFHGALLVALLELLGEEVLHLADERVDLFGGVEGRRLHVRLEPVHAAFGAEDLVVLFEYLLEAGRVERLIVLQDDERQVELAEGQLELVQLAIAALLVQAFAILLDEALSERAADVEEAGALAARRLVVARALLAVATSIARLAFAIAYQTDVATVFVAVAAVVVVVVVLVQVAAATAEAQPLLAFDETLDHVGVVVLFGVLVGQLQRGGELARSRATRQAPCDAAAADAAADVRRLFQLALQTLRLALRFGKFFYSLL